MMCNGGLGYYNYLGLAVDEDGGAWGVGVEGAAVVGVEADGDAAGAGGGVEGEDGLEAVLL